MSTIVMNVHGIVRVQAVRRAYEDVEWLDVQLLDAEGNTVLSVCAFARGPADQPVEIVDERPESIA